MPFGRFPGYSRKAASPQKAAPAAGAGGALGQKVKYLLLAGLVALYVTRQEKLLTGTSPWEVFSRLTALRLPPEGFGVGIGLLVLILLGMAVQPRFFCQFFCPMGAVFALLPVLPFARLHRQSDGCIPGCNACKQQCPVCLKLEETSLRSGNASPVKPAWAPALNRTSTGGIGHCARACGCRYWRRRCSSSCWAAGWVSAGLSEPKGGCRTVFVQQPPFWLGWIHNFSTPEHLRTLRRTIFTGKASAPTGLSCCAD